MHLFFLFQIKAYGSTLFMESLYLRLCLNFLDDVDKICHSAVQSGVWELELLAPRGEIFCSGCTHYVTGFMQTIFGLSSFMLAKIEYFFC